MRLLFLATSTVAIAVMFYGQASAEQFQADAKILPGSTSPLGSTFSRESDETRPILLAEDVATAEQLRDLIENKLQMYVPRQQDRAAQRGFASVDWSQVLPP